MAATLGKPVPNLSGSRHRRPQQQSLDAPPPGEPDGYERLLKMARRHLRLHRRGSLMQTTVLAHEVWLRIRCSLDGADSSRLQYAAAAIRAVLVDEARSEGAAKRGGAWRRIVLDEAQVGREAAMVDVLELDDALIALERSHPRSVRIVELRFFGGLSVRETAELLGIGERTVESEFRLARAMLRVKLTQK